MSSSLTDWMDKYSEQVAHKQYPDCAWLDRSSLSISEPSADELKWFAELQKADPQWQSLTEDQKKSLIKVIDKVEDQVAIIDEYGNPVSFKFRRVVSYQIAKVLFQRPLDSLDMLKTVIIDIRMKLAKGATYPVGQALLNGPNHLFVYLGALSRIAKLILDATHVVGLKKTPQKDLNPLRKQLDRYQNSLSQGCLDEGEFIGFLGRLDGTLESLIVEILQSTTRPSNADLKKQFLDGVALAQTMKNQFLETLKGLKGHVGGKNRTSLHISWATLLMGQARGGNVLVHELAHLLDFECRGVTGYASLVGSATDYCGKRTQKKWEEHFEKAYACLDPYAYTNRGEFFAVASELYFTEAPILNAQAPDLYALLEETYGSALAPIEKKSTLWLYKMFFFSDLSLLKISA